MGKGDGEWLGIIVGEDGMKVVVGCGDGYKHSVSGMVVEVAWPDTLMRPSPETKTLTLVPSGFFRTTSRDTRASSATATHAAESSHGGVDTSAVSPMPGSSSVDHDETSSHSVHDASEPDHNGALSHPTRSRYDGIGDGIVVGNGMLGFGVTMRVGELDKDGSGVGYTHLSLPAFVTDPRTPKRAPDPATRRRIVPSALWTPDRVTTIRDAVASSEVTLTQPFDEANG